MLRRRARVREVANVALVGGNREDLAARFDGDALARRRQCEIASCSRLTSFHCGIIHGKSPVAVMFTTCSLAGLRVEHVDVAGLLEHDGAAVDDASSVLTSKSVKFVSCVSFFDLRVVATRRSTTPSRSERKYDDVVADPHRIHVLRSASWRRKCDDRAATCLRDDEIATFGVVSRSNVLRSTIQIGRFWPPR